MMMTHDFARPINTVAGGPAPGHWQHAAFNRPETIGTMIAGGRRYTCGEGRRRWTIASNAIAVRRVRRAVARIVCEADERAGMIAMAQMPREMRLTRKVMTLWLSGADYQRNAMRAFCRDIQRATREAR